MNRETSHQQDILDAAIAAILNESPDGINEYSLLKILSSKTYSLFPATLFSDNLTMFKAHFVLFNSLYRLQRFYQENEIAYLEILATRIVLCTWSKNSMSNNPADIKLYDYYTNWTNYQDASLDSIDDLIDSFWEKVGEPKRFRGYEAEDINQAWHLFELDNNTATIKSVKRRYHQLMHNHHPDKGGDIGFTQSLIAAYNILLKLSRPV